MNHAGDQSVPRHRPAIVLDFALIVATALAFYSLTLGPTVIWGDSATLSIEAFRGTLRWGTAVDHPLFVLVGHWFSKLPGEVASNVNLAAAVFGALTVGLVYVCGRQMNVSRVAAAIGASALAVSPLSRGRSVHSERVFPRSHP
jgi:asparagine N-glycosylation enzyme membrane subunit Stt3